MEREKRSHQNHKYLGVHVPSFIRTTVRCLVKEGKPKSSVYNVRSRINFAEIDSSFRQQLLKKTRLFFSRKYHDIVNGTKKKETRVSGSHPLGELERGTNCIKKLLNHIRRNGRTERNSSPCVKQNTSKVREKERKSFLVPENKGGMMCWLSAKRRKDSILFIHLVYMYTVLGRFSPDVRNTGRKAKVPSDVARAFAGRVQAY